jgi:hypothetical protein
MCITKSSSKISKDTSSLSLKTQEKHFVLKKHYQLISFCSSPGSAAEPSPCLGSI